DVHSFIEAILYQRIGPVAGRMHTARSRNDQVATAFRLYVKEAIIRLVTHTVDLMDETVRRAAGAVEIILPGFTHLQHAQPVRLAHHLLAYVWMLNRDVDRLMDCYRRSNVLPLGSGAVAGVSYPVDRQRVAAALGFARISENSVDATGDRDFAVEVVAGAALLMVHLSRWSEELVLWASEGMPFREAHQAAGRVVQEALARGMPLWELPLEVYAGITPLFERDILEAVQLAAAVESKRAPGGTAKAAVEGQLDSARLQLETLRAWVQDADGRMAD